jgi:hypothetical protein
MRRLAPRQLNKLTTSHFQEIGSCDHFFSMDLTCFIGFAMSEVPFFNAAREKTQSYVEGLRPSSSINQRLPSL